MKNVMKFESMRVDELSNEQKADIHGGWWHIYGAALAVYMLYEMGGNPSATANAFSAGFKDGMK